MKYIHAIKGGAIAFVIFALVVFFVPGYGASDDVKTILTVTTFLFAIIVGFFIARMNSRYNTIREAISLEDAKLLSFYKSSQLFGKRFQNKVKEIIDKYYILVGDYIDTELYYKKTAPLFFQLYRELNKLKDSKKKNLSREVYDDMVVELNEVENHRNISSEFMSEKLSLGQWSIVFILGGIIIFCVFYLRVDAFYSQFITVLLSSAIILMILTLRDLQELRLANKPILIESGQEMFDFMGKLRYYNKKYVNNGYLQIQTNIKKYRLGLHKPGEKFNIKIVKNPNYKG